LDGMSIWSLSTFLKKKFLRVCPYGKQYLEKLVGRCKREILLWCVFGSVVLVVWNRIFHTGWSLYFFESILLGAYLIFTEVPNRYLMQKENLVYRESLLYMSRVKHHYLVCRHGANAVIDAAEGMQYEIICLAEEIYRLLSECNRKEKIRECILYHPLNRYLKMFLLQVYEVSEKGEMFFAENIEHLRVELMEELYRRKKSAHQFAGYVFVTVVPFFFLPVLKQWGLAFAPEMEQFYRTGGKILEAVTFVVTLVIYGFILQVKEVDLQTDYGGEKIRKGYFRGRGQKQRKEAVHEVRQFQAVLLMERRMKDVTIVDLLEDMELFSRYFRNCLRRCINAYGADPKGALLRMKKEGSAIHPGFGELADAFLSVDEAGIELSFAEVENDRHLLDRMTKLEAEINMERKIDSTDLVAKIPAVLAVGLYFIFPVFWYSLRGVYEVFRLLEEMQL